MAKKDISTEFKYRLDHFESTNKLLVDAENLTDEILSLVDLSDMSREGLEKAYARNYVSVLLYQAGYRSLDYKGHFVNPERCKNPDAFACVWNNAKINEAQKKAAIDKLRNILARDTNIAGQLEFDIDGNLKQRISTEDLIDILKGA